MTREELKEMRLGICEQYKIAYFAAYTEEQAASFMGKDPSTLKRWRNKGLIFPVIEPGLKGIKYFGFQIADMIMGRPQPWQNTPSETLGLETTGSHNVQEAKPGIEPGTTTKPSKHAALHSALRTLK